MAPNLSTIGASGNPGAIHFGAGVSLGGYQRILLLSSGDKLLREDDGSVILYHGATALGSTSRLNYNAGTGGWTRIYQDSSYAEFNSLGRMTRSSDRFGNATTYAYYGTPNDSLVYTITDPMGKVIKLCYNAGCTGTAARLHHVEVLSGSALRTANVLYDGSAHLIRAQDPDGYSDSLAYGANGLLSRVWDRARNVTDLTYDAMYRLQTVQLPTIALYDGGNGRPAVTYVPSERTVWQPSQSGGSQAGAKTGIKGDSSLKAIVIGNAADTTRVSLDVFGAPTKVTNPYGFTQVITRDANSRPTRVDDPDGHYVTVAYNSHNQLTTVTDSYSGSLSYTYKDTLTTDLATISGTPERLDFIYSAGVRKSYIGNTGTWPTLQNARLITNRKLDSHGRDSTVTDSLGHTATYLFEPTWGNLWKATDPSGNLTRFTYDNMGRNDSTAVPLMGKTYVTYGSMNQVLTQVSPGYKVTNTYDPVTLALTRVQTPRPGGTSTPVVYKYSYNALGAATVIYGAADTSKADTLKYDLAGNVRTVKTRRVIPNTSVSDSVTMTYDRLGRMLTRSGRDFPPDSFAYDNVKNRWQRDWNAFASNFDSLDARGQLIYWTQTVDGRTYTGSRIYDAFGRLTHRIVTWGSPADSSVMSYSYDVPNPSPTHDVMCAFYSPPRCAVFTRNGDGRKDKTYFNWQGTGGTQWQSVLSLDSNHRITNDDYTISGNGLDVFDLTFTYDSVNRVTKRTSPLSGYTKRMFSYDSLGRLLNACDSAGGSCHNVVNGTSASAWSYDSAGNRAQVGTSSTYGAGNRITAFGTTTFGYDSVGNIVCRIVGICPGTGAGFKYSFDVRGRLRGIRDGNTGALVDSLYYDARGRRVRKGRVGGAYATESYVYEGDQVILDVDSATGAVTWEYAWYPGAVDRLFAMRTATDTLAALEDPRLGTLRGLARFRNGVIVKRYAESPWGDAVADTGLTLRYRFGGREYDSESNLYYLRRRYYDPQSGRFLSEDPQGIDGGLNIYSYAGNDPVNSTDPFGLAPWHPCDAEDGKSGSAGRGECGHGFDLPDMGVADQVCDYECWRLDLPLPLGNPSGTGSTIGFSGSGGESSGGAAAKKKQSCWAVAGTAVTEAVLDGAGLYLIKKAGGLIIEGGALFEKAGRGLDEAAELDRASGRGLWTTARETRATGHRIHEYAAVFGQLAGGWNAIKLGANFIPGPAGFAIRLGLGLLETVSCFKGD